MVDVGDIKDEDFLAMLESDQLLYSLATQKQPISPTSAIDSPSDVNPNGKQLPKIEPSTNAPPTKHEPAPINSETNAPRQPTSYVTDTNAHILSDCLINPNGALTPQAMLNARERRRGTTAEINTALQQWRPTLAQSFGDEGPRKEHKTTEASANASKRTKHESGHSTSTPNINTFRSSREACGRRTTPTIVKEEAQGGTQDQQQPFQTDQKEQNEREDQQEKEEEDLEGDGDDDDEDDGYFVADKYQAAAIHAALAGKSFFLTGSAGTGKSFVLKHIISRLRSAGRSVGVTASTGCAAVGIGGGTIHSFAGVGIGMESIERLVRKGAANKKLRKRFLNLDTLIIDEISMIDSFLFDKVEAVIRAARAAAPAKTPRGTSWNGSSFSSQSRSLQTTGGSNLFGSLPFGGLQVIVCGDFFQLPPVGASDSRFAKSSEKFFAFESKAWQKSIKDTFVLQVVHRQADRQFAGLLNEVRQGIVSENTKQVLNACLVNPVMDLVEAEENGRRVAFTKLFSYRRQVAVENSTQLKKLKTKGLRYEAFDCIHRSELGTLTYEYVQQMLNNTNCIPSIELRRGCRVLCTKNLDTDEGIVNGAAGIVVGWSGSLMEIYRKRKAVQSSLTFDKLSPNELREDEILEINHAEISKSLKDYRRDQDDCPVVGGTQMGNVFPVVLFDNGIRRLMEPENWEVNGTKGQVVGFRRQVPLMHGWALSIHKAQGMTLRDVETDVGGAFDYGQVYVALSRATIVQRLRLRSFNPRKIVTHPKVTKFYNSLSSSTSPGKKRRACGCRKDDCEHA